MKLMLSCTSVGVNLGMDNELYFQLPSNVKRISLTIHKKKVIILPDGQGIKLSSSKDVWRCSFRDPLLRKAYPKHGMVRFESEEIKSEGDGFSINLPEKLPPFRDLIRKNNTQKIKEVVAEGKANVVISIETSTFCFRVPEVELLKLAFEYGHKGYSIREELK